MSFTIDFCLLDAFSIFLFGSILHNIKRKWIL